MESCIAVSLCNFSVPFACTAYLTSIPSTALYRRLVLVELQLSDIYQLSWDLSDHPVLVATCTDRHRCCRCGTAQATDCCDGLVCVTYLEYGNVGMRSLLSIWSGLTLGRCNTTRFSVKIAIIPGSRWQPEWHISRCCNVHFRSPKAYSSPRSESIRRPVLTFQVKKHSHPAESKE
ncbi:hypothetical protein K503DRAFT_165118 [Rhizopogon vinicolor AM-OR11-026]|uniref:Uncharacterized protein n=1 Tax=Rhizopogon vinicolor AM-OR11-026 TaxID=1314800 RepID=A0A1B7N0I1_9AGAM|nr:hypothetical protein K503DRAFT_165118 [Rhizopogon vinicolor AM-OR11-026]